MSAPITEAHVETEIPLELEPNYTIGMTWQECASVLSKVEPFDELPHELVPGQKCFPGCKPPMLIYGWVPDEAKLVEYATKNNAVILQNSLEDELKHFPRLSHEDVSEAEIEEERAQEEREEEYSSNDMEDETLSAFLKLYPKGSLVLTLNTAIHMILHDHELGRYAKNIRISSTPYNGDSRLISIYTSYDSLPHVPDDQVVDRIYEVLGGTEEPRRCKLATPQHQKANSYHFAVSSVETQPPICDTHGNKNERFALLRRKAESAIRRFNTIAAHAGGANPPAGRESSNRARTLLPSESVQTRLTEAVAAHNFATSPEYLSAIRAWSPKAIEHVLERAQHGGVPEQSSPTQDKLPHGAPSPTSAQIGHSVKDASKRPSHQKEEHKNPQGVRTRHSTPWHYLTTACLPAAQSAPRANEPAAKERERIHTLAQRAADTDPPSPTHADADIWYGQLRTSWLHSCPRAGDLGRTAGPVTAQRGSGRADWLRGMRLRPGASATEPRCRQLGLKWAAGEDAFTPVFQLNWDLIGKRQIDAH
ncbi:predicted protein [Postia placenta Mad-698-R]|nr:predicted protein [Postia placenta Mad-698-R]